MRKVSVFFGRSFALVFAFVLTFVLPYVSTAQVNRSLNFSFEVPGATLGVAANWNGAWGGYSRSSPTNNWDGAYAAELNNSSDTSSSVPQQRGFLQKKVWNQTFPKPILITMRVKGEGIASEASDKYGAAAYCKVIFEDGTLAGVPNWCPTTIKTKNVGTFGWRHVGWNTATLPNGNLPVREIDFGGILGAVSGKAWFDDVHVAEYDPELFLGAVTIMPDDCYKEHRTYLLPLMQTYGWVGTAAAVKDYLSSGDPNYCTLQDLQEMKVFGWEVASHTVNHSYLSQLSPLLMENQLYESLHFFKANGFDVRSLALPFGDYNATVIGLNDERAYYSSIRKVERGYNPMGTFPYDVRAQELKSGTSISEVKSWVQEAKARKAWLVIFLHKIRPVCPDQYCNTPALMEATLEEIKASGLPVVTYEQGLSLVKAPR